MDTDGKPKRLLSYSDVADKLGYSKGTVENKVAAGELPFTKIKLSEGQTGAVRFREDEVDAWIEKRASDSEAA